MKRITPKHVLEAYDKTGIEPKRGDGDRCAIAALHAMHRPFGALSPTRWADDEYGREYVNGFAKGFDGTWQDEIIPDEQKAGYKHGTEVASRVFAPEA